MSEEIQTIGRPKADINWKRVDELLEAGCSGAEIAGYFGLNKATIYERCVTDHDLTFTEYSQRRYAKGESLLREIQYNKALGITEKGDNTMLVWLGKTRLKQREEKIISVSEEDAKAFDSFMNFFSDKQKSKENNDSTSLTETD